MKTKKISLIIIIVLAILVGIGVYSALNSKRVEIYLFKDDYKAGTLITEDMFVTQQVDKSIVEDAIANRGATGVIFVTKNNIAEAIGHYLRYDVYKGTPFLSNNVDVMGGSPAEVHLGKNMVAVTIPVDNMTGVTHLLGTDSRINIYAGFEQDFEKHTVQLLENVRVLDVLIDYYQSEIPVLAGVTVEVTQEEAVSLTHVLMFGSVRLGAVKVGQYEPAEQDTVTTGEIIGKNNQETE
jgi:Flp pilus assembly protein CpaB